MYNFKIDRPGLASGTEVQINGLGIFENGKSYFISKEDAETFRQMNQTQHGETDAEGNTRTWTEKGPTLLQAFQDDADITVVTTKTEKSSKPTPVQDVPAQEQTEEQIAAAKAEQLAAAQDPLFNTSDKEGE